VGVGGFDGDGSAVGEAFFTLAGDNAFAGDSVGLAAAYADRLLVMKRGLVEAEGPHRSVLITEMIAKIFDVDATIIDHPSCATAVVMVIPHLKIS
jgi:hypothetical protein